MQTPLPGDIIFCKSSSVLGWLIRWAERRRNEPKSYANHTAGIGSDKNVVEAVSRVASTDWLAWTKKHKHFEVWRYKSFTPSQRIAVARAAEIYLDRKYGWWKLFIHLGDSIISKVTGKDAFFFRRVLHVKKYPICSWVWAWAYYRQGVFFGTDPAYADPDGQHDHVQASDDWKMVLKV